MDLRGRAAGAAETWPKSSPRVRAKRGESALWGALYAHIQNGAQPLQALVQ